jgi:hypothetical protein
MGHRGAHLCEILHLCFGRLTGEPECAGINQHVVGDERALQERKQRIHPGLEFLQVTSRGGV